MLNHQLTYKQFNEKAILIAWKEEINEELLNDILAFKEAILNQQKEKISDIIVGYNSLTLVYNYTISDFSKQINILKNIYNNKDKITLQNQYIWEIPVCYNTEFGIDLKELAQQKQLSVTEIINLHTQPLYTVYFIGFLPGFLYLGGLQEALHTPRKQTPRLRVPKGSVAIGGSQTGIYPQESAGGWNIIGKTPLSFFDIEKPIPCFAKSGDKIKFVAISYKEFQEKSSVNYQPKKILHNAQSY